MVKDSRLEVLSEKIIDAFPKVDQSTVDTFLESEPVQQVLSGFLEGQEPHKLLVIYHPDTSNNNLSPLSLEISENKFAITDLALYIIRKKNEPIPAKDAHLAIISGLLDKNSLQIFQALLEEVYIPYFKSSQHQLNEASGNQLKEFVSVAEKFTEKLSEAISSNVGTAQLLSCPEPQFVIGNNQKDIRESIVNSEIISHYEGM